MANFNPTQQQMDVTAFFTAHFDISAPKQLTSIFLNAVAGAGKTSTIMLEVETLKRIEAEQGRTLQACSVSFNTNIRDASQKKLTDMGSSVQARTTNQLGRSILANAAKSGLCKSPEKFADAKKYQVIAEDLLQPYMNDRAYFPVQKTQFKDYRKAIQSVAKLVTAVRSTRTDASEENLLDLVEHYKLSEEIDVTAPHWELVCRFVDRVIQTGVDAYNNGYYSSSQRETKKAGWHDFDDQIVLPLQLDLAAPLWDVIFIDEAQDLNRARLEMITRSIKPTGVLFFVGDPSQAIQGFTFSDTNSVQTIKNVTGAIEFPLSVCWRCNSDIVRIAQVLVPHIEARSGAPEGIVSVVSEDSLIKSLQTGYGDIDPDLVLCRVKAPLVQKCLEVIRNGKKAIVRGRDIGKNIVSMLEEVINGHITSIDQLSEAIEEYTWKKVDKLSTKKDSEAKIDELRDRADTLVALLDGYQDVSGTAGTIDAFKEFINSKFSDEETTDGERPIIFSTIHKAKGLEYRRVFIMETGKLPHPMAKPGWQMQQEYNILYVACTRAKEELYFVDAVPASLQGMYNEINHIVSEVEFEAIEEEEVTELEEIAVEALETISEVVQSLSEVIATDTAIDTAEAGNKAGKGRQAYEEADKVVPLNFRVDPSLKTAFQAFVAQLKASGDWGDIIPSANFVTSRNEQHTLTEGDVLIEMMLSFEPFKQFFETSEEYLTYLDRKNRQEEAREKARYHHKTDKRYNTKKRAKSDDNDTPEDDGPGGGGLTVSSEQGENPNSQDVEQHEDIEERPGIIATLRHAMVEMESIEATSQLTEEADRPESVKRCFYTCLSKFCKKSWYVDYKVTTDGQMYRTDDNGQIIYAALDFPKCPYCPNSKDYIKRSIMKHSHSNSRKCDSRCWNAKPGSDCRCACNGTNHATGSSNNVSIIGKPLLPMVAKEV